MAISFNSNQSDMIATDGGVAILSLLQNHRWIPCFWEIKYTTGFPDGEIPKMMNELIGTIAAINVLSQLAPTYGRANSTSLSFDNLSQSVSTVGPEIFTKRIEDLKEKREMLIRKVKSRWGQTLFTSAV
jgi:hypothetical protein